MTAFCFGVYICSWLVNVCYLSDLSLPPGPFRGRTYFHMQITPSFATFKLFSLWCFLIEKAPWVCWKFYVRNREHGFPYIAQERTPQNAAGSVALLNWAIALSDQRTLLFDSSLAALHSFPFAQKIKDRWPLLSDPSILKSDVPSSERYSEFPPLQYRWIFKSPMTRKKIKAKTTFTSFLSLNKYFLPIPPEVDF
jgi:hypothetical protein